jgi:hypothetical protein
MDADKLLALAKKVNNVKKLDRVYKEILYPKLERAASELKQREIKITDNCYDNPMGFRLEEIMGKKINLQTLIETEMKPYLEKKGFKIGICSPSYMVYIRW